VEYFYSGVLKSIY